MKFSKLIAAFFTAAMLISLAGCSDNNNKPADTDEKTNAPIQQTTGSESTDGNVTVSNSTETGNTADATSADAPATEAKTNAPETEAETEVPVTEAPVTEAPGAVPDSYREDGENGIKIIGRNGHYMGLMPFWGTFECCERYAAALNKADEALPNVNVYSMVIPTPSEFYVPEDITGFTASQKEKIDYITERLKGPVNIDVYSVLQAHIDEHIYFRTDHHWQPLGAYYAAKQFAKTAGVFDKFPPLSDYNKVTKDGCVGSLYYYAASEALKSDPEPFTMYISPNDSALKTTYYSDESLSNGVEGDLFVSRDGGAYYTSFLDYRYPTTKIETDCTNGKTLLVMKESFGNALIPFLTECYQTIYVCDVKDFESNVIDFCKKQNVTDLLFATCVYTPAGEVSYIEKVIG